MRARVQIREMIDPNKLSEILEPMIRKVVREELARVAASKPNVFYLEPNSPLYQDMEQILRETQSGPVKLLSREFAKSAAACQNVSIASAKGFLTKR